MNETYYRALLGEARLFCERVEKGKVQSKKTYEAFKEIIRKIDEEKREYKL